ncbi:T1SS associated transglutaminase-like cysteine proteinase LapP [hydrothermal vent metagenome]|uniref:T1SS associated transglutaminase-like cysteine proteinase LapP n=1 Tax=hydrothermal vent metagenome TaxID=652676 RepID=A0A3B1C436_9ZZZZ
MTISPGVTGQYTKNSIGGNVTAPLHSFGRLVNTTVFIILVFTALAISDRAGLSQKVLDYVADKYGSRARNRLLDWEALMENNKNKSEAAKLKIVNNFFNRMKFVSDQIHWKQEDYWATPVEFLATRGGDCEDFSIAKYFTLRELGVPDKKMLITYVKALRLNQAHMVLTYYKTPNAEPLVLDNLIGKIKLASKRKDLAPVYSFNGEGLWLSKKRGKGNRVGSSDRLSLWKDLGQRMEKGLTR